jgi:hypothetical protein
VSFLNNVDDILYEFEGQLTYSEILEMTYKEIDILRKHRRSRKQAEAKSGAALNNILSGKKK